MVGIGMLCWYSYKEKHVGQTTPERPSRLLDWSEHHEKIFSSCWEGFCSRTLMESYNEDNRCLSEIFALIQEKANSFVWAFLPTSRMSREKIPFFLFTWRKEIGETNHTSRWQAPPTIDCLIDSSVSAQTGLVSYLRSALSERSSVHQ